MLYVCVGSNMQDVYSYMQQSGSKYVDRTAHTMTFHIPAMVLWLGEQIQTEDAIY